MFNLGKAKVKQSQSDYWVSQKKGKITASKLCRVIMGSSNLQEVEGNNDRLNASTQL